MRRREGKRRAMGIYAPRVDSAVVAERLHALVESGIALQRIAAAAGIRREHLMRIAAGQHAWTTPRIARKIWSVDLLPRLVPPTASALRVQIACANGWTQKDFAALMGRAHPLNLTSARRRQMTYEHAQAIITAMDTALATWGGSANAAAKARGRGVLPAERYDTDLLHDPAWDGLGGVIAARSMADKVEDFAFLVTRGTSEHHAAQRVGMSVATLREYSRRVAA